MNESCTKCGRARRKHERWFWINSNARPPVVYCPACAAAEAPANVAARAATDRDRYKRAAATRRRRSA